METLGRILDRALPAAEPAPRTEQSSLLIEKWDWTVARVTPDTMTIAQARKIADAPLPDLVACSEQRFDECLYLMLANLPKRNSDQVSGELLIRAYSAKLGGFSEGQIAYLTDKALERCEWFPTIAQCLAIIGEWQRDDAPLRLQNHAKSMVLWDRQRRFDEVMAQLSLGAMSQEQIDALPDSWKAVGETRSYLWQEDDGRYVPRVGPNAKPLAIAGGVPEAQTAPRHSPSCRKCHDLGRILTIEGEEADCPECGVLAA